MKQSLVIATLAVTGACAWVGCGSSGSSQAPQGSPDAQPGPDDSGNGLSMDGTTTNGSSTDSGDTLDANDDGGADADADATTEGTMDAPSEDAPSDAPSEASVPDAAVLDATAPDAASVDGGPPADAAGGDAAGGDAGSEAAVNCWDSALIGLVIEASPTSSCAVCLNADCASTIASCKTEANCDDCSASLVECLNTNCTAACGLVDAGADAGPAKLDAGGCVQGAECEALSVCCGELSGIEAFDTALAPLVANCKTSVSTCSESGCGATLASINETLSSAGGGAFGCKGPDGG